MTSLKKRNIFLIIVLLLVAGGVVGYKMWNKPFIDALSGDAIKVTPEQLLAEFEKDEAKARDKFVPKAVGDKILELEGEVVETGTNDAAEIYLIFKTSSELSTVKCILEKENDQAMPKVGDKIVLRGFCNGYLADEMIPGVAEVIINRSKIVKDLPFN